MVPRHGIVNGNEYFPVKNSWFGFRFRFRYFPVKNSGFGFRFP